MCICFHWSQAAAFAVDVVVVYLIITECELNAFQFFFRLRMQIEMLESFCSSQSSIHVNFDRIKLSSIGNVPLAFLSIEREKLAQIEYSVNEYGCNDTH